MLRDSISLHAAKWQYLLYRSSNVLTYEYHYVQLLQEFLIGLLHEKFSYMIQNKFASVKFRLRHQLRCLESRSEFKRSRIQISVQRPVIPFSGQF
jgi:hypothetical protein